MISTMFSVVIFSSVFALTFGDPSIVCPAVDGEHPVYIPQSDCTKFYQCSNGLPYLHNCPDGLHFNPVLNVCDWPEDAGCGSGSGPDPLTTDSSGGDDDDSGIPPNGSYTLCPNTIAVCPPIDGAFPLYIPHPDCTKFCQCSNGLPYLHNCPDGLHFNPVLNVCDWPRDAGCNGTDTVVTTDSSSGGDPEPAPTTDSSGGDDDDSGDIPDGSYALCPDTVAHICPPVDPAHPVYIPLPDCTKFCQCSNGLPYLHNCPDSLHFNPILNVCDWPEDAGCSGNGTDTVVTTDSSIDDPEPAPTTDSSGGDDTGSGSTPDGSYALCPDTVPNVCPPVDPLHPVYIPLPDCTKFCQCSNGLPYLHDCPDNLHFNPVLNVCDWSLVAGCTGTGRK